MRSVLRRWWKGERSSRAGAGRTDRVIRKATERWGQPLALAGGRERVQSVQSQPEKRLQRSKDADKRQNDTSVGWRSALLFTVRSTGRRAAKPCESRRLLAAFRPARPAPGWDGWHRRWYAGGRAGRSWLTIFQIPRPNERLTIDSMPAASFNSAHHQRASMTIMPVRGICSPPGQPLC